MENASKALIIAGAILLSILIIGLGMLIFNQAKDAISNTGMDKQKVDAYNSEFEAYVGDNVNGTRVRSLIDTVRTHNISNVDDDTLKISVNNSTEASQLNNLKKSYKAGNIYKVEITEYSSTTGYITKITVTDVKTGSSGTQSGGSGN